MMGLQYQYNEAAANNNMTRALEMGRKTGYEAQGQQIENAGLNKALMYGGGGASATSQSQGNSGVNNTGTQAVAMGLQARAIEAQVSNTEADTALKIAELIATILGFLLIRAVSFTIEDSFISINGLSSTKSYKRFDPIKKVANALPRSVPL